MKSSYQISGILLHEGLQEGYPLETLPFLKPRVQRLREENSETHVDSSKPKYKNLVEAVTGEDNDGKLQEILDSYSDGSLRGYLNYVHRKDLHKNSVKVLASLYRTLLEAGFHFDPKLLHLFADAIIRNGIPMRILRYQRIGEDDAIVQTYNYYAVLSKHQQRIIDVINNDPELQKYKINPVTLVCGEHNGNIPNTTKLNDKRRYGNTGHAIRTVVGYRIGGRSKVKAESLLRDCAVPILKYRNHLFYPLDREQELADFIKSKQSMFPPRKS